MRRMCRWGTDAIHQDLAFCHAGKGLPTTRRHHDERRALVVRIVLILEQRIGHQLVGDAC
ncbi:MAG: hypothetical protein EXQ55_07310 [Acidobacteria bacterium]|nr:hypothetical protein [Acidobacteriota bacterium]